LFNGRETASAASGSVFLKEGAMRLFRWYRCYKRCSALLIIPMLLLLVVAALPGSQAHAAPATFVGPKQHYLALGDSMAFGYQPDLDMWMTLGRI
jgi:hypothetical protein